jgi:hypothetical protein
MNTFLKKAPIAAAAILGIALAVPAHANEALLDGTMSIYSTTITAAVDITINADNSITVALTGAGPYDGVEDSLVDVINNSSTTVTSLTLNGGGLDIFGFDGDGISTYSGLTSADPSGYGSPDSSFSGIGFDSMGNEIGTVNFAPGITGGGGTDYFSLEENLAGAAGGSTPITVGGGNSVPDGGSTAALLGCVLLGLSAIRRGRFFAA